jgi:PAN domain
MRSSSLFDTCGVAPGDAYIESIEHYYAPPRTSYLGSSVELVATTITSSECQVLCDYFSSCYSVRFNAALAVKNCELLGGSKVAINATAEGVLAALDVNLFTAGWSPDNDAKIVTFSSVFDQDECRTLCEEHASCGAFLFKTHRCTLYKAKGFAVANETMPLANPYYVSYHTFVDPDQEFVEADGLCVDDSATVLETRATTRSEYDCASRCNRNSLCTMFTYNMQNSKNCVLYGSDARLYKSTNGQSCPNSATAFVMYTPAMFTLQNGTCLKNEGPGDFVFFNKQLVE